MNGFNFGGAAAPAAPAAGGGMFIPGLGIIRSPGLAPPHAPPGNNTSYDSICSACGATTFGASCCCGNDSSPAAAAAAGMLGNNGSAGSPGLQNFSSLGFGNANNNNALNTNLNNAASAASSPATPATGGGFSFDGNPSASSSFSSSPSTTTEVRISGQASPKMLMVSQKNIQIKAEAAMTDILVNRWGPHMLEMLMKEFNSMPDSQQLEQMMCSWLPGNNIKKI